MLYVALATKLKEKRPYTKDIETFRRQEGKGESSLLQELKLVEKEKVERRVSTNDCFV